MTGARLFGTEMIGHLFGCAQATDARALALVGDDDANACEFSSSDWGAGLRRVPTDLLERAPASGRS